MRVGKPRTSKDVAAELKAFKIEERAYLERFVKERLKEAPLTVYVKSRDLDEALADWGADQEDCDRFSAGLNSIRIGLILSSLGLPSDKVNGRKIRRGVALVVPGEKPKAKRTRKGEQK